MDGVRRGNGEVRDPIVATEVDQRAGRHQVTDGGLDGGDPVAVAAELDRAEFDVAGRLEAERLLPSFDHVGGRFGVLVVDGDVAVVESEVGELRLELFDVVAFDPDAERAPRREFAVEPDDRAVVDAGEHVTGRQGVSGSDDLEHGAGQCRLHGECRLVRDRPCRFQRAGERVDRGRGGAGHVLGRSGAGIAVGGAVTQHPYSDDGSDAERRDGGKSCDAADEFR